MENEKRLSARTNISLPLNYQLAETGLSGSSWSNDFSIDGIGMLTEHVLSAGSQIEVEARLENEAMPISFKGVVAWSRRSSAGGGGRYHKAVTGVKLDNPDVVSISKIMKL